MKTKQVEYREVSVRFDITDREFRRISVSGAKPLAGLIRDALRGNAMQCPDIESIKVTIDDIEQ